MPSYYVMYEYVRGIYGYLQHWRPPAMSSRHQIVTFCN